MTLKYQLVLPAYNEANSLRALMESAVQSAQKLKFTSDEFKIVLVNNGSTDHSSEELKKLKSDSTLGQWFDVVLIEKNQGYGFGLWTGLSATIAPIVGYSHADLQCDPENALKAFRMLSDTQKSNCLIKGTRSGRNWKDQFVSAVFRIFARVLLGLKLSEINAQPKVFHRNLLSELKNPPLTFAFDLYLLFCAVRANYKIIEIPVLFPPRIHGASKWASHFFSRYKTILGIIKYMWNLRDAEGRL